MSLSIRTACPEDAEALLEIYAPYVRETAVTFEYEVPPLEEFRGRIEHVLSRYPYLAAEEDGRIVGYAYLSAFHPRAAYGWCAEPSVYVEMGQRGRGIGRRLYEELERRSYPRALLEKIFYFNMMRIVREVCSMSVQEM